MQETGDYIVGTDKGESSEAVTAKNVYDFLPMYNLLDRPTAGTLATC